MRETITVTGMVLSAAPIGEYDRRIVLLTKERGKIAAFAKGARKTGSSLLTAVNPFAFGTFLLYEGKNSYNMMQADISNYFSELRTDVEGAYYGFYFLDLAGYYSREGNDETDMLKLLYQTMRALTNPRIPKELIRYIFELKSITINGEGPEVFQCAECGAKENPAVFSVKKGGLLCKSCIEQDSYGIRLDNSTLYTLQYIVGAPPERMYNFIVNEEVLSKLRKIVTRYMEHYVGREFKSLEILKQNTSYS